MFIYGRIVWQLSTLADSEVHSSNNYQTELKMKLQPLGAGSEKGKVKSSYVLSVIIRGGGYSMQSVMLFQNRL